jgi:2-dehydropantoate 2-reductase
MSRKIKNIAVFGIGGIGGYFGGRIAHKINKYHPDKEVYFIARGEHLRAIQEKGLKVITDNEELLSFPNIAIDRIRQIPTPDLYLLCVKGYDIQNAVTEIAKNIYHDTIILPLLNGVDIYERVSTILPRGIVIPAAVYVSSYIEKPGVIRQKGPEGRIVFGPDTNPKYMGYDYQNFKDFFSEMEIRADWFDNPYPAIWEKYVFIAAFGLTTAYSGKSIGGVLEDSELKELTENIMKEIAMVARSKGVDLRQGIIESSMQVAGGFPYDATTSFQKDYAKKNGRNEGDIFGGTLIRMAKNSGIPIPNITEIYNKLIS